MRVINGYRGRAGTALQYGDGEFTANEEARFLAYRCNEVRFSENLNAEDIVCMTIGFVPFGALLGYITGTCAAGVFLVMDAAENYFKGQPVLDHHPRPTP